MSVWVPRPGLSRQSGSVSSIALVCLGRDAAPRALTSVLGPSPRRQHHFSAARRPSSITAGPFDGSVTIARVWHGPPTTERRLVSTSPPKSDKDGSPTADDKSISPDAPKESLPTRVWAKVKHEAAHYYHGSKLLVSEVRISSRLMLKLMRGGSLTRRENRQVINATVKQVTPADELVIAQTDDHRSAAPDTIFGVCGRSVYGTVAASSNQTFPQYVTEYI